MSTGIFILYKNLAALKTNSEDSDQDRKQVPQYGILSVFKPLQSPDLIPNENKWDICDG